MSQFLFYSTIIGLPLAGALFAYLVYLKWLYDERKEEQYLTECSACFKKIEEGDVSEYVYDRHAWCDTIV